MINYFTKYRDEIFQYAIIKSDVKPSSIEELTISHLHSYLGMRGYIKGIGAMAMPAEARMAASEKGYENGIRVMPAEARVAAREKVYENGLGAMPAKARMAAREKGYENGIGAMSAEERTAARGMGIKWENKYAEFKRRMVMPEEGTTLHTWQKNQLSNGHGSLNAKIRKALAENEGSTIWSERRVKLFDCVSQKKCDALGNKWESKYAEFKRCMVMPEEGTTLHTWQSNQLSTGTGGLNAKIRKEVAENEGSTVWSERRVKFLIALHKRGVNRRINE
jgi:hypothetical protein